jgi:hypothetical protein
MTDQFVRSDYRVGLTDAVRIVRVVGAACFSAGTQYDGLKWDIGACSTEFAADLLALS